MGTSNESTRSTDEEEGELIFPWALLPYSGRLELINKLNPDVTMSGNDWRMLASELGYTTGQISYIESDKDNNTTVLFRQYDTKPGASINEVYRSLEKMQRQDCLDIIINVLPEIQQAYNKAKESQRLNATKKEMPAPGGHFQWPGSPYSCPYSPHPTSPYGSHTCYPCSHSFTSFAGACQGHCLGSHHSYAHLSNPHHCRCQSFGHNTAAKTCEPGFSSPHPASPGCHGNVAQPLGSCSPCLSTKHNTLGNQACAQCSHSGFSPRDSSYPGSPTCSPCQNGQKDNMMVEHETQSLKYRQLRSLQQYENLNGGRMTSDLPTAFPETLLTHQSLLYNNEPLPNNIPLDNGNLISSDSNSSDSFNSRQQVARQYLDDCNITKALVVDKKHRNNSGRETLSSGDSINQHRVTPRGGTDPAANIGFTPRSNHSPKAVHLSNTSNYLNYRDRYYKKDYDAKSGGLVDKFSSHVSDQGAYVGGAKTSLAHLEKLATVPYKFKPTHEYKTVVAEQRIEMDKRSNRDGKVVMGSSFSQSNRGTSSNDRSHNSTVGRKKQIPEFSHIKVFVTYSYDNETHGKQVLSLCKFIKSNGFTCSVDVSEKKSSAKTLEKLEWCRKTVLEADFVLVCISKKYLEDISSASTSFFSQTNERQLHTREIYELMNSEFLNGYSGENNSINTAARRFVPLLFPEMSHKHVPPWMMNGSAYTWPKQYKDLVWMLSKPQDRFFDRRKAQLDHQERERNGSDLDVDSGMDMTNLMTSVLCSS